MRNQQIAGITATLVGIILLSIFSSWDLHDKQPLGWVFVENVVFCVVMCEGEKPSQSFPGSELFTPEQVKELSGILLEAEERERRAVNLRCVIDGITSKEDRKVVGFHVSLVQAGLLAFQTANLLGQNLPDEEVLPLVCDASAYEVYPYEEIPRRVHSYFAQREAASKGLVANLVM